MARRGTARRSRGTGPNVTDKPADDDDLLDFPRGADAAERSGEERGEQRPDEQVSRYPFKLRETTDVHRLEPIDDAPHEDAEDKHRQNHVEEDAQLHDQRHAGRDPEATRKIAFSTVSSASTWLIAFLRVTIRNSPIISVDSPRRSRDA